MDLRQAQASSIVSELLEASDAVVDDAVVPESDDHSGQTLVSTVLVERLRRAVTAAQRFARRIVV